MAVIVKYDQHGKPHYRSAKGIGSSELEREKAKKLDDLLKKELTEFKKRVIDINKNDVKKGNVSLYWELGKILRNIFYKPTLIDPLEKHLFWLNARIHAPEKLIAKDRSPNRIHLEYCFRLAGFPKEKSLKLNWGEWVYLFDSPGINRESRFDSWLEKKMNTDENKFTREDIRMLAQSINKVLGNIETKDLSDEQLYRAYDAVWITKNKVISKYSTNKELKISLIEWIKKNRLKIGKVISGELSFDEFETFLDEI